MSLLAGYCAYAYFEHCDPYTSQWIGARDQILPYLSLYMFATVAPGLAGVYMSAVFGATLSTTSSSINSCSVVLIEDIIKPMGKVNSVLISVLSVTVMLVTILDVGDRVEISVVKFENLSPIFRTCHQHISLQFFKSTNLELHISKLIF